MRGETMNKAYKFRLYPTKDQSIMFAKTFGCVRFIYNKMLADRIAHYKSTGERLNNTPAKYKEEFEWLKEVDSLALANAQLHLNDAYKNFWSNKKNGFPKFKSKKRNKNSYSTNNQKGSVRIEGNKIKLPKIGLVKLEMHRQIEGKIKTVTISKAPSGKYYISILVEYENQILPIVPRKFLGLDYAMNGLYVSSDGECANYPKYFRLAQKKLARIQRKFSRSKKLSKNHEKLRIRLSKIHEKIANRRRDFLHKLSAKLVSEYDLIAIEDLNMQAMSKKKCGKRFSFGKSVSDNGWGMFTQMLEYKSHWMGKSLVKIDRFFPSSQIFSGCGYQNSETKNLSVREWKCPECGAIHDRDINAAINIRNEGMRIFA
ncbi:MAG: IS200/IS605 family element transposase accessory protein TnpB [Selenomonadaceae bacterium]|nr:IS200/IS605 family element transposase accessory protein TnpB [Selenomonadaceae bacterium]